MESQRDLVMRMSAKADPSLTQPMKDLAKTVKDAAGHELQLFETARKLPDLYKLANAERIKLVGYTQEEIRQEQQYQQVFRQRRRDYDEALRKKEALDKSGAGEGKGWIGGLKDLLTNPHALKASAAGAVGLAVAHELSNRIAGQRIAEYGYGASGFGLDRHAMEGRMLEANAKTMQKLLGWIPGLGGAVESHNYANRVGSNWYRVETNLRESREAVERNQALGERRLGLTLGVRGYEREASRYRAMAGYSPEQLADAERKRAEAQKEIQRRQRELRVAEDAYRASQVDEGETQRVYQRNLAYNEARFRRTGMRINTERTLYSGISDQTGARRAYDPMTEQAAKRERDRQKRRLEEAELDRREQEGILSLKALGMNSASQQARLFLHGQGAIGQMQETLAKNPNAAGYNRQAALADYQGTVAYQVAKRQAEVEQQRQLGILGYEQKVAGGHQERARLHREEALFQVATAERNLNVPGLGSTQIDERRNTLLQTQNELARANKEYEEAIAHSKELQVQQSEMLNQHSQKRLAMLEQESTRLHGIVREERERETGRREHFGLAHPMKQRTALGIARKMAAGLPVTQSEIQFAQGMPEIFDQRLKKIGLERTGAGSMYQEIRQLFPELGQREKQAEKALANINLQFHNEIQLNEGALTDQLQKKLLPEIYKAIEQAINAVTDENKRFANQQAAQMRAQMQQL